MRKILNKLIIGVFVVIIGYIAILIFKQEMYISELNSQTSAAQQRLEQAQRENEALTEEKQKLRQPEYIEKVAREELGMTRPGEVPYISSENK